MSTGLKASRASFTSYQQSDLSGQFPVPRSPRRPVISQAKSQGSSLFKQRRFFGIEEEEEESQQQLPVIFVGGDEIKTEEGVVVDPTHLDPYLQQLSDTSFHWSVFVKEFIFHAVQPLAYVFLLSKKGRILLANRSFTGKDFVFFNQWGLFLVFALVHVCYFVSNYPALSELLLLDVLWAVRNLVVATKFGFTSTLELTEMEQGLESKQQRLDRQVLTGWVKPSELSRNTQILLASVRQGVDLTLAEFEVCQSAAVQKEEKQRSELAHNPTALELQKKYSEVKKSAELLQTERKSVPKLEVSSDDDKQSEEVKMEEEKPELEKSMKLDAWTLALTFVDEAVKYCPMNFQGPFIFSLIHALVPVILPLIPIEDSNMVRSPFMTADPLSIVTTVLNIYINFFLMFSNFSFVNVAEVDIKRRDFTMRRLEALLEFGYVDIPKDGKILRMRLAMDQPKNLVGWWYLRTVLQDYGRCFYKRISAYIGYFSLYLLALVAVLLFQSIYTKRTLSLVVVVLSLMHLLVFTGAVARVLYHGDKCNDSRRRHGVLILKRKFELGQKENNEILGTMYQMIALDNDLNAMKILGFKASADLLRAFGAVIVTGLAAGIKIAFHLEKLPFLS